MQSYLQYRRFGAELSAFQERDKEQFHRQHSSTLHDRVSIHKAFTLGHSRLAVLGDQFYLHGPSSKEQEEQSKQPKSSEGFITTPGDTGGSAIFIPDGVEVVDRTIKERGNSTQVFVVHFKDHDPDNPQNWSLTWRVFCVLQVAMIGFLTLTSSSIDAAVAPQAAEALHVSDVVEYLATGMCRLPVMLALSMLTIHSHVADRLRGWLNGRWTFLRNIWKEPCLSWQHRPFYDLRNGSSIVSQYRGSDHLQILRGSFCFTTTCLRWRHHLRPIQAAGQDLGVFSLCHHRLRE